MGRRNARASVIRWPGHIKDHTVLNQIFASWIGCRHWLISPVDRKAMGSRRRSKPENIPESSRPRSTEWISARTWKALRTNRRETTFFYYTGRCAVRRTLQELEDLLRHGGVCPTCGLSGPTPYHWTQIQNIKRDPFERLPVHDQTTNFGMGGALPVPVTAYVYDWNMASARPVAVAQGTRVLWAYPAMQDPASYNLSQVMQRHQATNRPPVTPANKPEKSQGPKAVQHSEFGNLKQTKREAGKGLYGPSSPYIRKENS